MPERNRISPLAFYFQTNPTNHILSHIKNSFPSGCLQYLNWFDFLNLSNGRPFGGCKYSIIVFYDFNRLPILIILKAFGPVEVLFFGFGFKRAPPFRILPLLPIKCTSKGYRCLPSLWRDLISAFFIFLPNLSYYPVLKAPACPKAFGRIPWLSLWCRELNLWMRPRLQPLLFMNGRGNRIDFLE